MNRCIFEQYFGLKPFKAFESTMKAYIYYETHLDVID